MRAKFNSEGQKQCPSCLEYKDLTGFRPRKWSKNGYESYCQVCLRLKKKQKRESIESKLERRRFDLYTKYRLLPEDFTRMFHSQGGRCPICLRTLDEFDYRRTVVDHCHASSTVRGLLCTSCNSSLGKFGDSPEVLQRAIDYIQKGGIK